MPIDKGSRVAQLGVLLEHRNRTIRQEAASAFANFLLSDEKTRTTLLEHLTSVSWEARVSTADALINLLKAATPRESHEEENEPTKSLQNFSLIDLIENYRPLLSAAASQIDDKNPLRLNAKQQRTLIDQHLDFVPSTGQSSQDFIQDSDVLAMTRSDSPKLYEQGAELTSLNDMSQVSVEPTDVDPENAALEIFVKVQLSRLANEQWQTRHGASLAITRILSSSWTRLRPPIRDLCALRLLQILTLDRFIDFVSGRTAVAPVRESASQALAHYMFRADKRRRSLVLDHLKTLLSMEGEKQWICRQSALLVMKYHFVIAPFDDTFTLFFNYVAAKLDDPVDDVISTAVTALSSLFENLTVHEVQKTFIEKVVVAIWNLLAVEAKKDQLRAGLDTLAVDLLEIIGRWLEVDTNVSLTVKQLFTIVSLLDAAFVSRTHLCVRLIATAIERGVPELPSSDIYLILHEFYRVLLFAPPTDSLPMLERLYLTTLLIVDRYRGSLALENSLVESIGLWISCLMMDHKNPNIDVVACHVKGQSINKEDPYERMGSEEMRFLDDREKDSLYITRKILAAKFLAPLIQTLYHQNTEVNGQHLSTSLQLCLLTFVQSTSLYQNLGAAIITHEWSLMYKVSVTSGNKLEPPLTLISALDYILRQGHKTFDELTSTVTQLTTDCNEFITYCCARGAVRNTLKIEENSIEDVARTAYEQALANCKTEKQQESIESRYQTLQNWIEFTKIAIRTNSNRVFAFLAAALFNFGCIGEKFTPLVRPLMETMQLEENETVAAEVFKGAVPLLIIYSWQRNPKPYVKVISKTIELFSSCPQRIPKAPPKSETEETQQILSLLPQKKTSVSSKNAELFLHICCTFPADQLPEFYEYFDLDADVDDECFIQKMELHRCLWSRVASQLSEKSTVRILAFLSSHCIEKRHAAAKALATFCSSSLADTLNRVYTELCQMIANLEEPDARRGAMEGLLCISLLGTSLVGCVSLLAPLVFPRLADSLPEVREAASRTFRNFVPILTLEKEPLPSLSPPLHKLAKENSCFIHVLSQPSFLPTVKQSEILALREDIELRHYQLEGITWMRFLRRFGLNGVLADDMGLGKTLQTLATIALSISQGEKNRPSLIVCPRTLIDHWLGEWKSWFPTLGKAIRGESSSPARIGNSLLVVTAYEDLKVNANLSRQPWSYVILDEGHILRNTKTAVWRAVNELTSQSRLILSGTPVQNSAADLWALFAWLMPGYLGDEKQFRVSFLRSILKCRSPKATEKELQAGSDALSHLHRLVLPFVLRRIKQDVLPELPEKIVQDYECELTDAQRELYKLIADRCTTNSERLAANLGLTPLHTLLSLRKVVDDPSLIADIVPRLEVGNSIWDLVRNGGSGKMAALGELLTQCGIGVNDDRGKDEDNEGKQLNQNNKRQHAKSLFLNNIW
ncbi:unnamed protein product, partial [Mesorhabditis belari]|uniref:Helicase ATP-binding domain-containing protein n=1 Tax=Mesorhabditis belari TaxID=2138241 RepID=A0AAF3FGZ5_9BILA